MQNDLRPGALDGPVDELPVADVAFEMVQRVLELERVKQIRRSLRRQCQPGDLGP
jgi:hypothetical protein